MQQPEQSAHVPSLIDVQLAFAQWRQTRSVRGPTPDRLRQLAVDLLRQHRAVVIYKALDLNAATLKQWAAQSPKVTVKEDESQKFITVPVDIAVNNKRSYPLNIALPNGVQVCVQGDFTLSELLVAASELGVSA